MRNAIVAANQALLRYSALFVLFLSAISIQAQQQTITVKGTIRNPQGEPLPAVSILLKGSANGVTSGADGSFQLKVPANSTLVISSTGYLKKELKVSGSDMSGIAITLQENRNDLDQVIVVGYGTRKKSDVTGSITSINEKSIQDVPSANITQAIQGQGAGIDIQKANGNSHPGQSPNILIRGSRSVK